MHSMSFLLMKNIWACRLLSLLALAFMVNCASSTTVVNEDCAKTRLSQCLTLLQTINNDHNLAFAYTEFELGHMCRTMHSGVKCVEEYVVKCFDPERIKYMSDLLKGTEEVIGLLCTPGKFRDEYKNYAPCMKKISLDPKYCGNEYKTLIQSVDPPKNVKNSDPIRRQCCAFRSYLLCVTEASHYKCGSAASDFIKDYSLKTAGSLIQNQCKNYVSGSLMCHFNSSPSRSPHLASIIASVILALIISTLLLNPTEAYASVLVYIL